MPPPGLVPTTDSLALVVAVIAVYPVALWLPGGLLGAVLGLRGWVLAAVAPVLTYFVVGVAGPLSSAIGVRWSPPVAAAAVVLSVAVAAGLRWLAKRFTRGGTVAGSTGEAPAAWRSEPAPWARPAELVLSTVVLAVGTAGFATIAAGMGDLSTVPQDWDALFHANGIRYIADTGDAGLYGMASVNWYGSAPVFYPNAYHALAAVVYSLTGAPIPVVLNVLSALMPGLLALSLVALVRQFGGRAITAGYSAVIGLGATSLIYDNLWRGPLLPFTVGAVCTPVLIILLDRYLRRPAVDTGAVLACAAVGLLALHPSTLFGAVLFAVPMLVQRWWRAAETIGPDLARLAVPAVTALVLGSPLLLGSLAAAGQTLGFDWPATFQVSRSVGSLLVFQHDVAGPQLSLAVPLWVGLAACRRLGELRWLLGTAVLLGALFVAAASYDNRWVTLVTSPWWNDQYRLIALATIPLCVIAGHGLAEIQQWLTGLLPARSGGPVPSAVVAVLVLAVFAVLSDGCYTALNATVVARGYAQDTRGTLTRGELAAIRELGRLVQPGQWVMNDRGDGTGWMYALAGVRPVAGHFVVDGIGPDAALLGERFSRYDTDPDVRAAAARLHVGYVLVGSGFVRDYLHRQPGLWDLADRPFLDVVYRNEDAVIYRLDPSAGRSIATPMLHAVRGTV